MWNENLCTGILDLFFLNEKVFHGEGLYERKF